MERDFTLCDVQINFYTHNLRHCSYERAIAQAVNRRPHTAEQWVRYGFRPYEILWWT
jgi:hypothetical protein